MLYLLKIAGKLDARQTLAMLFVWVARNLGPYSQRLIFFVTYEWAQKASLFIIGKLLQPSVM